MLKGCMKAATMAACVYALPASAAVYDLGTLTPGVIASQPSTLATSASKDQIYFALPTLSDIGVGVNKVKITLKGVVQYDFSSLTATFYKASDPGTALGFLTLGDDDQYTNLTAGSYYAEVQGVPTGNKGGFYSLALLSSNAAPVPGPAGLLIVGAGAAVVALRRRRREKAAA